MRTRIHSSTILSSPLTRLLLNLLAEPRIQTEEETSGDSCNDEKLTTNLRNVVVGFFFAVCTSVIKVGFSLLTARIDAKSWNLSCIREPEVIAYSGERRLLEYILLSHRSKKKVKLIDKSF